MRSKFIKLTDAYGDPVYIDPAAVTVVYKGDSEGDGPLTWVYVGEKTYFAVKELQIAVVQRVNTELEKREPIALPD